MEIDWSQMTMEEAIAAIKMLLDGHMQLLFACENIIFSDTYTPPQSTQQKALIRKKIMNTLELDEFTAKRLMEEALEDRELRIQANEVIEECLSQDVPKEEIVARVMEDFGMAEEYVVMMLFLHRTMCFDD